MHTFSHAPCIPARRLRQATPKSLAAVAFVLPRRLSSSSRPSAHSCITASGGCVQALRPCSMALLRACFSSGVCFGIAYAALTCKNACVSCSIAASSRLRSASACACARSASSCTASYFFLPSVRPLTIAVSAAPTAPASAAALPPPGAGDAEAISSVKPRTVSSASSMCHTSHSIPIR